MSEDRESSFTIEDELHNSIREQLVQLAARLCPWNLADRVAAALRELRLDAGTHDVELHWRLARIRCGVDRVVALFDAAPFAKGADALTGVLENYAAAIACLSLTVGCDELIMLADARLALWCAGIWASSSLAVRWC